MTRIVIVGQSPAGKMKVELSTIGENISHIISKVIAIVNSVGYIT